jgi:CRISPR type I-E-associated protein CasB/Cse2
MNAPDYQKQNADFVAQLVKLCKDDRGHRAALRRWWSDGTRHYAYPLLGKLYALDEKLNPKTITAALYGAHLKDSAPAHLAGSHSIGSAALKLGGNSSQADAFPSMERHFRRLLAADPLEDLGPQLHRLVKRLERESIPLDYARLLGDLRQFRNNPEAVKTRWSIAFWQAPTETPANP